MAKTKTSCPICDGAVGEARGFFSCESHGIVPYDWAVGTITRDKALAMMAKWGHEVPRKAAKAVSRPPTPPDESRAQGTPPKGVAALLAALRVETNPADKRRLRAKLRAAGHTGGIRGTTR